MKKRHLVKPKLSYQIDDINVTPTSKNSPMGKHRIHRFFIKPLHLKVLENNIIFKRYMEDDDYLDFVEAIFRIESRLDVNPKRHNRIYIENIDNETVLGKKSELKEAKKLHKWKCAYCKTDIIAHEENFSPENFCCERCAKIYLNKSTIKTAVIDSSYKFSEMLKNKIKRREYIIISYLKDNLKT